MFIPTRILEEKLLDFLKEDIGYGDFTTKLLIPDNLTIQADIIAKEEGIIAGIEEALVLCESLSLKTQPFVTDGTWVKPETILVNIVGDARTILSAERTILNLVSRMSGISTVTNRLINKVIKAGFNVRVSCTRKTAPGLAYFDKKAVYLGQGDTHRFKLDDMILIKSNHISIIGNIKKALEIADQSTSFSKKIEIEVTSKDEAIEAAKNGADIVMLDNFSPEEVKEIISTLKNKKIRNNLMIEVSGGINHNNIVQYAETGADILSLGEITHSVKSLNVNMRIKNTASEL